MSNESAGRQSLRQFATEPPKLVANTAFTRPDVSAIRVIEQLSHSGPVPNANLVEVRRRYRESRTPLLAALEPVESIFRIRAPSELVPPLTVIRPRGFQPGHPHPAIVYLHGGGWTVGEFETYEPFCRKLANATNQIVVWVDYRLAPEHPFPAAFDDALNAYRWVRRNADRIGIDYRRIAIGGDSAGGNLAAAASVALRDQSAIAPPAYQLLLYPCLDLTASAKSHARFSDGYLLTAELYGWYRSNYLDIANPLQWRVSPLFAELRGVAPTILLYTGFDPLRDEAADYAARLEQAGVEVRTLFFADMIHGFLTMGGAIPAADTAVTRIAEAVRALGDAHPPTFELH